MPSELWSQPCLLPPVSTDKGDAAANLEAWEDWRMEATCYYFILGVIYEICATFFSAEDFKSLEQPNRAFTECRFPDFFIVVHAVGNLCVFKGARRLRRSRLFLRSFVLDRLWIPGEYSRGICAVEFVTAHLRWFEEGSGSGVVFWIDEWLIEFGHH